MDIIVARPPADKRGEDIVDQLVTSIHVAVARGRNAIDRASMSEEVDISRVPLPGARLGSLVETHDALYGVSWRGRIGGISHRDSVGELPTTTLRIVRPL